MKYLISELSGPLLDDAVAKVEGLDEEASERFRPTTSWADGGPIVERERIAIYYEKNGYPKPSWVAGYDLYVSDRLSSESMGSIMEIELEFASSSESPLVAAMRSFVMCRTPRHFEIELP